MNRDLVEQTTTTTGTGDYALDGSVTDRRSFSAFPDGASGIPYVVRNDAGGFECGYGTYDSAGPTLARDLVVASSNSNAAVSWAAGAKRIYVAPHAGAVPIIGPSGEVDLGAKVAINTAAGVILGNRNNGEDAAVPVNSGVAVVMSQQYPMVGVHQHVALGALTEDGSPWLLYSSGGLDGIFVNVSDFNHALLLITGNIMALENDGTAYKLWSVRAVAKVLAGTLSIVGSPTITAEETAGTVTGWAVNSIDIASGYIVFNIEGAAATSIGWAGDFNIVAQFVPV